MGKLQSFSALIALSLSYVPVFAAIGPIADMTISNGDVTPDGFTRAAVLVNGQVPGPLVTGNKVWLTSISLSNIRLPYGGAQGDNFQLNVIDSLTNETMLTATTVVRIHSVHSSYTLDAHQLVAS